MELAKTIMQVVNIAQVLLSKNYHNQKLLLRSGHHYSLKPDSNQRPNLNTNN